MQGWDMPAQHVRIEFVKLNPTIQYVLWELVKLFFSIIPEELQNLLCIWI